MDEHPLFSGPLPGPTPPETPVDAGSQALSEALRSSFVVVKLLMLGLVALFIASGLFVVGPQQQAIILRFGRPLAQGRQALLGPGLHWSFPSPIDEPVKVSISGIQQVKSTIGWFAVTPEQELSGNEPPAPFGFPLDPVLDGSIITADANIIHARATLTYYISDPINYLFNFANASNTVQSALDNALLYTASRFKVDDILKGDVLGFRDAVRRRVAALVQQQGLGITIDDCVILSRPPRQLKQDFESVNAADTRRNTLITEARGYEIQTTNHAAAEATSRIKLADSERAVYVADICARAKQFQELLPRYNENPALFVQQRLVNTLGSCMTNLQDKIFDRQPTRRPPGTAAHVEHRTAQGQGREMKSKIRTSIILTSCK